MYTAVLLSVSAQTISTTHHQQAHLNSALTTIQIAEHEDEILKSLAAAADVDLALARGRLGTKTAGTIPKVTRGLASAR